MLCSASRPSASTARIARSALTAAASLAVLAIAIGGIAPARAQNAADPDDRRQFILDPTQVQAQPAPAPRTSPGTVPGLPAGNVTFSRTTPGAPMQVNADQMVYEEQSGRVSARGSVQIYYDGRTIEADTVTFDQRTNRVRATGNVRITEPSGTIAHAQDMEFDQQFTQGFIRSLNMETTDRRFIGARDVTRENGDTTIFERATYTACDSCRADQTRPPTWTVKAKRVIHRESERTIYFEDGRFEFFGIPLAYVPRFWTPDPTVRKASGLMMPGVIGSNRTGMGAEIPYFWNIQPNYDLLIAPRYYSRQGFMPVAEWRHGFESGYYTIRAAGIRQRDPSVFTYSDGTREVGNRDFRGIIQSMGIFRLTERWSIGWDVNLMTDTAFLRDYALGLPNQSEANSRVFLRGQGPRSWFDLSATRYVGITASDVDNKILPTTHPVLDYFKVLDRSVAGGEVAWRTSIVSLTRESPDISSRNLLGNQIACNRLLPTTPGVFNDRSNCLVNGIDGTYSRVSAELSWRRRIIDAMGQVWEPFVSARGDISYHHLKDNGAVLGSFDRLTQDNRIYTRFMPTVGLTYRYPWIAGNAYGTTTVEPIVQFIARPNESNVGRTPNEDAQSLVFDDTNLFQTNKFSGWDRVEGGGRMNYGLNVTHRFNNGSTMNVMFGQSLHLFGLNSFSAGALYDMASTGANSGLDKPRSDYVARVQYQLDRNFRVSARGRFDERTFAVQRGEVDATARIGALAVTGIYGYLAPQPDLGYQVARSSVGTAMSYSLTQTWTAYGALRFALQRQNLNVSPATVTVASALAEKNKVESLTVGLNYLDDAMQLGFYYSRDFAAEVVTLNGIATTRDIHRFMFRFNLRTLGELSLSQNVSNWFNSTTQ